MTDPINAPIGPEDPIYDSLPPPKPAESGEIGNAARTTMVERQRERERNDLLSVLGSSEGRAVIMRILAYTRVYHTTATMVPGVGRQADPIAEGRRDVGLYLIAAISQADPERYARLLLEHLEQQRRIADEEATLAENARRQVTPGGVFDRLARRIGLKRNHAPNA